MERIAPFGLDESAIPHVFLDWEAYYDVEYDEVSYGIASTDTLIEYADKVRHSLGFVPCFIDFGTGTDDDGYYDFYIVADANGIREFYFVASVADEDDWGEYNIPMTDSFKAKLYERLNVLSAERCGGTVRELIELNETEE